MVFDHLGRVHCIECGSVTSLRDVADGEALFLCNNPHCNNVEVAQWPVINIEGQERRREAA